MRLSLSRLLAPVLLLSACATPGPELDDPLALPSGVLVKSYRYTGTGLGGPLPSSIEISEDLVKVVFRCYYLEREPELDLELLVRNSRFLADQRASAPLQVTSLLALRTYIGQGSEAVELERRIVAYEAGRFGLVHERELILPVGVTAACKGRGSNVLMETPAPWNPDPQVQVFDREMSLHVSRRPGTEELELLLVFEGPMPLHSYDPDAEETQPASRPVSINERMAKVKSPVSQVASHESLMPEMSLKCDGEPVALVSVSPFDHRDRNTYVVFVEAHPLDAPLAGEEAAALRAELEASALQVERRAVRADVLLTRNRLLWKKFLSVDADREGRRALVLLTDRVGARMAGDFILVVDESLLMSYIEFLREHGQELPEPTSENAAWALEKNLCALLAERMGREDLPPEVAAILVRHLGEVGRSPATIEELLSTSSSLAGFMEQVRRMNEIFLEDSDPSVRVRAFDWLAAYGGAPSGYDPLAPLKERREALERLEQAAAEEGGEQ